jgi:16S rRNA (guanine966-N2)-methyltransferase
VRIVAGEWRGRIIQPPADPRVRPTADRVREAWFSIIGNRIVDARVLDLFGGSGALSLEALSRGAAHADVVELSARSLDAIRANARLLGAGDRLVVHRGDALRFVRALPAGAYDVAVADPPYGVGLATQLAELWLATPFSRLLAIEHRRDERLPGSEDRRKYGDTVITWYHADD